MARPSLTKPHLPALLELVQGGLSVAEACAERGLSYPAVNKTLWKDRDWRARFDEALADRGINGAATAFNKIVDLVRSGKTLNEAVAEAAPSSSVESVRRYMRANPERRAELEAALAERESGENARRKKWSDSQIEDALQSIKKFSGKNVEEILDGVAMPSYRRLRRRAEEGRLHVVVGMRPRRLKKRLEPKKVDGPDVNHRNALLRNEMFAAVNRAVGYRSGGEADREDVVSEIILDILEGKLDLSEFAKRRKKSVWRPRDFAKNASLDVAVGDDGMSAVDFVPQHETIFHY